MNEPNFTQNHAEGTYVAHQKCLACEKDFAATIQGADLFQWRQGAFVQDAFPYLTTEEREVLFISGYCDCIFDLMEDEHVCVIRETPDGMGCATCLYH